MDVAGPPVAQHGDSMDHEERTLPGMGGAAPCMASALFLVGRLSLALAQKL